MSELGVRALGELGVEAVLWDVDGTLMAHHADRVDPSLAAAFGDLRNAPGLRHAVISNCRADRFAELGRIFPDVPILLGYETEAGAAFRVRRGEDEAWRGPGASAARAAGEAGLRPLRKPSRRLVRAALEALGAADRPHAALMVGDQYFTDIASANLAAIRSLKVATLHRASFPTPVRASQRLEGLLYRLRYGRPRRGLA